MSSFEERIGELKQPRTEMGGFGTEETRNLQQAMDILAELRVEAYGKNDVAWSKLLEARKHLDEVLKHHLEGKDGKTKREEEATAEEKTE